MAIKSRRIQNAKTIVDKGVAFLVNDAETLIVAISGTSTSFTIVFEGSLDGINYTPLAGEKESDDTYSSTTSTLNESWKFDVSAYISFRANLIAIENGNVTVVANSIK